MNPTENSTDEFAALVHRLRLDFRRLFPHLCPQEEQCFFVRQNPDKTSGKVWIEYIKPRDLGEVKCIITIRIENNRAVKRIQQEFELGESLEHTDICTEQFAAGFR